MDYLLIGAYLQELRKKKGITQQELAIYMDVSKKTIQKWETGVSLPEIPLLQILANYYDVTIDDILNAGPKEVPDNELENYQKKANEQYFLERRIKRYDIFFLVSCVLMGFGLFLLYGITYTSYKAGIAIWISTFVLFVSILVLLIGNMLFGKLSQGFCKESKLQFQRHTFGSRLIYSFLMLSIVITIVRFSYVFYQNEEILKIDSLLTFNLFCLGICLAVYFIFWLSFLHFYFHAFPKKLANALSFMERKKFGYMVILGFTLFTILTFHYFVYYNPDGNYSDYPSIIGLIVRPQTFLISVALVLLLAVIVYSVLSVIKKWPAFLNSLILCLWLGIFYTALKLEERGCSRLFSLYGPSGGHFDLSVYMMYSYTFAFGILSFCFFVLDLIIFILKKKYTKTSL